MKGLRIRIILNNNDNLLAPPNLMGGADFAREVLIETVVLMTDIAVITKKI